jgi:hypothetical protein
MCWPFIAIAIGTLVGPNIPIRKCSMNAEHLFLLGTRTLLTKTNPPSENESELNSFNRRTATIIKVIRSTFEAQLFIRLLLQYSTDSLDKSWALDCVHSLTTDWKLRLVYVKKVKRRRTFLKNDADWIVIGRIILYTLKTDHHTRRLRLRNNYYVFS